MTYARFHEVHEGTKLKADGGFSCIRPDAILTVGKDREGLFVDCDFGPHYLDGQLDETDEYIGFYLV